MPAARKAGRVLPEGIPTLRKPMEQELRKELRQYAWAYFDRHAEQRLKIFNFYLILCGAIVGLFSFTGRDNLPNAWPLPFLLSFVSFIFWKLDVRVAT
jgi:hypothetical protein